MTNYSTGVQFEGEAYRRLGIYSDGEYAGEWSRAWGIMARKGVKQGGVE